MERIELDLLVEDKKLQEKIIADIQEEGVFIYPTDTIYGIGCDASNAEAVLHIRRLKRSKHPFSVIAPSKEWIKHNLIISHPEYIDNLPVPYTLVFEKKDKNVLKEATSGTSLGVRIPDYPITWILQRTGLPIVTTSANVSGSLFLMKPEDIKDYFDVDFFVDAGNLSGNPSKVIDLTGPEPRIIRK